METAIVVLWALVVAYVMWAAWFTHDMGPASENGPLAGLTWAVAVLGVVVVGTIHGIYRLAQWAMS